MDYSGLSAFSTAALWAATLAFSFVSGIIPFVLNIEVYLLAVAALTDASLVPIVGLATAGQTLAKYLLYLVGRGSLNIRWVKKAAASKAANKDIKIHSRDVLQFKADLFHRGSEIPPPWRS